MDERVVGRSDQASPAEQVLIHALQELFSTLLTEAELSRLELPADEEAYQLPLELRGQVQLAVDLAGYEHTHPPEEPNIAT